MADERDSTTGHTPTAELEHEAAEEAREPARPRYPRGERRFTTAGLGMYERVTSIAGSNTGFGLSPGLGAATPSVSGVATVPGITGLDLDIAPGEPGTIHDPLFTEADDSYWRENFPSRPYAGSDSIYEEYRPAYQYGTEAAHRFHGRRWEQVESELEHGWNAVKGSSSRAWHEAKHAARDAWHRIRSGDVGRDRR
jgi:hypothetical protein